MKKFSVLSIAVLTLFANIAQAAFLAPGTNGRIEFTAGCFAFGDCTIGGVGNIPDNGETSGGIGSGIAGDGLVGIIDFTMTDANNFTITSFSQDSYLYTPVGTKAIDVDSIATMSGFISDSGDITLDLTGRISHWSFFDSLGIQAWNLDDSILIADQGDPQLGGYDLFTSGTTSAWTPGSSNTPTVIQTGEALTSVAPGEWTGTIVMSGNTGKDWGVFDGSAYAEAFNIRVTAVPVPAAAWLFGSGLAGLAGMARRNKIS